MTAKPTGVRRAGNEIALSRTFKAPIDHVWQAVTDPERLARWYGTWSGDCESGRVSLVMTAEEGHGGVPVDIERYEPPRLLAVRMEEAGLVWRLALELAEESGTTTLTLVQTFAGADEIPMVGPGWEYYLDRLVAAEAGQDVDAIDFDRDYYPAQEGYYRDLVASMSF